MAVIDEFVRAVLSGRHRFSHHAMDELALDHLHVVDAESAILTGQIIRTQPKSLPENPGPRYTVVGKATDLLTNVAVVCRLDPLDQLIIITCYELKHE